jgi:hypothetical protein
MGWSGRAPTPRQPLARDCKAIETKETGDMTFGNNTAASLARDAGDREAIA